MASGTVIFSDGEKKGWTLDQMGRIALSGGSEEYKPSEEDVVEFQKDSTLLFAAKAFDSFRSVVQFLAMGTGSGRTVFSRALSFS